MDREIKMLRKLIPEDIARAIVNKLHSIEGKQTSETTISENTDRYIRCIIQELNKRGV
jgi:hypothetical protein